MTNPMVRTAAAADADVIHALIVVARSRRSSSAARPRRIRRRVSRFVVYDAAGAVRGCAELAPLGPAVAEVRSLVVARDFRRTGAATALIRTTAPARPGRRFRNAVRVHARPALLRPAEFLDRPAPLGAGKDRKRLRLVPALPALRPVRDDVAARWCRSRMRLPMSNSAVSPSPERSRRTFAVWTAASRRRPASAPARPRAASSAAGQDVAPLDLAIVAADGAVPAAAVFTTNKAVAAPVVVSREHLARHSTVTRARSSSTPAARTRARARQVSRSRATWPRPPRGPSVARPSRCSSPRRA